MRTDRGQIEVIAILRALGCQAEAIPEAVVRKTADIRAVAGSTSFIVEVESRDEDRRVRAELSPLPPGQFHTQSVGLAPRLRLAEIVEHALEQLRSTTRDAAEFLCVWFRIPAVLGRGHEGQQMFNTLLGTRIVACFGQHVSAPSLRLISFTSRSVFAAHPDLDAVFVQEGSRLELVVNAFGARVDQLRSSGLYGHFAERGGLCDPCGRDLRDMVMLPPEVDEMPDAELFAWLHRERGFPETLSWFDMYSVSTATRLPA